MATKVKKPWHMGTYHVTSRKVVAAAHASPQTRCWRCGRTLAEHPLGANGKPQYWTAGHIVDGQPGGPLAPEASRCNFGAHNRRPPGRPDLTWH